MFRPTTAINCDTVNQYQTLLRNQLLQQTAEMVTEWFLLAVVASTVMASGGEGTSLQCPDPEDIAPCSCVVNDDNEMDFECPSEITEEKLAEVFTAKMPNNNFNSFKMEYNTNISVLRDGVFGTATFRQIEIRFGKLVMVEEEALSGSYNTLEILALWGNRLAVFPVFNFPNYKALTTLYLSDNKFTQLPMLNSDSLTVLQMGYNQIHELPKTAFQGLPNLEQIYFDSNGLTTVSPGMH